MLSDTIKYGSVADVVEAIKDVDITKGPIPPFYTAVISKRKDMIGLFSNELIKRPFKVTDSVFGSPHTFALTHSMPDVTCFLVDHGYDPNATINGVPILHIIDPNYTMFLIERGANINAVDSHGVTLLMKTCLSRSGEFFVTLIQNHADVNAVDCKGNTALHFAVSGNFLEAVHILLNNGAIMVPNADNKTPLELANSLGFSNIVEIITKHQGTVPIFTSSKSSPESSESFGSRSENENIYPDEEIIM